MSEETPNFEELIEEVQQPLKLTIKLAANEKVRLQRLAADSSLSVEDYLASLIRDQLNTRVGAAVITGPSHLSGHGLKKVMGPRGTVTRSTYAS